MTAALAGCGGTPAPVIEVPPPTVTVVQPVPGSAERHFAFRATVVPRTVVRVVAETAAGRIVELRAEPGQRVAVGDILARLDDREIRLRQDQSRAERARVVATQAQAQAQQAEAQATLDDARAQLRRIADLVAGGSVTAEARDARQAAVAVDEARLRAATAQVAAAEADLRRLDAQLAELTLALERTVVAAPVPGMVVDRAVEIGDRPAPGTTLMTLAEDGVGELAAEVPERYLPAITVGQAASVRINDAEIPLTVRRVDGLTDIRTRTGIVRMAATGALPAVLGAVVVGRIPVATVAGLRLPMSALRRVDPALVMVVRDGRAAARPVELAFSDGATAIIAGGLDAGDLVVARAPGLVEDGQRVRTVAATAAADAR
jgi:HlyD family secretion protein